MRTQISTMGHTAAAAPDAVGLDRLVRRCVDIVCHGGSIGVRAGSGMGATTFLRRLVYFLTTMPGGAGDTPPAPVVVCPDLTDVTDAAGFIHEVTVQLVAAARRRALNDVMFEGLVAELPQLAEVPLPAGAGLRQLEAVLGLLSEATALVLVVAEGLRAVLAPTTTAAATDEAAVRATRGLVRLLEAKGGARLSLCVSDTPDGPAQAHGPWRELTNKLEDVPLDPLTEKDVIALVTRNGELSEVDAKFVYRMVGGHPRLVLSLANRLARFQDRGRTLDAAACLSLAEGLDATVGEVVAEAFAALLRQGAGRLVDAIYRAALVADATQFAARDLELLWPHGLVDLEGRFPERIRAVVARGGVLLRASEDVRANAAADEASGARDGDGAGDDDDEDPHGLGKKQRLLFNYLLGRVGSAVGWPELAAAYFVNEPEVANHEEKALNALRAAINRINARLAPSEAAARGGWKVVRYARGQGFYVDPEVVQNLGQNLGH